MTSEQRQNPQSSNSGKSPIRADETVVRTIQEWMDHPSWDLADTSESRDEDIQICLHLFNAEKTSNAVHDNGISAGLCSVDSRSTRQTSTDDVVDAEDTPPIADPSQRFVFERLLGVGAFGIVVCVFDNVLARRVALKLLRPSLGQSKNLVRRFLREVQVAASLDHSGVVRLFETGRIGSHPYIMSAVIDGPNLSDYLKTNGGKLTTAAAVELIASVAEALQYAHERGVLHRDLKPSNILLAPGNSGNPTGDSAALIPLLTDFGLAKRVNDPGDQNANLSDGVQMLGTLRYSSPEQAAGRLNDVGTASDIYSLGTILYQCLTGSPPHDGDSNAEILRRVLQQPTKSLRATNANVSADLDNVVLKSLSRERQDRYATAGEFAADLRRFLRGEPVLARRASFFRRIRFWARQNPAFAALAALFVITTTMALSAIVWLYLGQRDALKEAESNRAFALRTVADAYDDVAQTFLEDVPNTTDVRCNLALKSLEKHLELVEQFKGDALSRYRLSVAYHYAAKTVGALDRLEERDKYFTECMSILEQLIKEDPGNVDYRFDLFFNKRLWVIFHTNESFEWRAAELRKLVLEIDEICRMEPDNLDYRDVDSATKMDLADMLATTRPMDAIPLYLGAAAVSDELLRRKPTNFIYTKYALVGRARAAEIYLASGQLGAAEELCKKMVATLNMIPLTVRRKILFEEIEREPQDALARLLVLQNQNPEATASLHECDERYQRLLEYFPDTGGFLFDHLRILSLLTRTLKAEGLQVDSEAVKERLKSLAETPLAKAFPPDRQKKLEDLLEGL